MKITMKEFDKRVKDYVAAELVNEERKPDGMCGNWSYSIIKRKELKKKLAAEGIEIED